VTAGQRPSRQGSAVPSRGGDGAGGAARHHGPTRNVDLRFEGGNRCQSADGVELYYEIRGTGDVTLTFLNHLFLVAPAWRTVTSELEQSLRLVAYDLRNQGASTRLHGALTWSDHVEDLRHLLDCIGVERTYLLGTSMSAMIARDFALAYPERVAGLLLVGPAFSPYGSQRRLALTRTWIYLLETGGMEVLYNHLYALCFSDFSQESGGSPMYLGFREVFLAVHSPEQVLANLAAAQSVRDEPEKLTQLSCPTLLMVGDTDFLWSTSSLTEMQRIVRGLRVAVIPRAGHLPYAENTSDFEREALRFIEDCEQQRAAERLAVASGSPRR